MSQLVVDVLGPFYCFGDDLAQALRELLSQPMQRDTKSTFSHSKVGGVRSVGFGFFAGEHGSKCKEDRLSSVVGVGGGNPRQRGLENGQGPAPLVDIFRSHAVYGFESIPTLAVLELEGHGRVASAPLLRMRRIELVGQKVADSRQEKAPESPTRLFCLGEPPFLKYPREECLG